MVTSLLRVFSSSFLFLALAVASAAPAAAAPEGQRRLVVAPDVPFSSAELAEALYVRGAFWSWQIRVRLGPEGQAIAEARSERLEINLEGRRGAAAARVVALALIGAFGTDKPATPPAAKPLRAPSENRVEPIRPPAVGTKVEAETPPEAPKKSPRKWLTFGPTLATLFPEDIEGEAAGLAAGYDIWARRYVRATARVNVFATHYSRLVFPPTMTLKSDARTYGARLGLAVGTDYLSLEAGPLAEYVTFDGDCETSDSQSLGGYTSARAVVPLGGAIGLVAAVSYSFRGATELQCGVGVPDADFVAYRPGLELMAGFGYGM